MHPSRDTTHRRAFVLTALAGAVILGGCAGSNLFGLAAAVGAQGPLVEITAPTDGVTVDEGASLQVTATAEAPDGINSVTISGVFKESGEAAYVSDTQAYQAAPVVNVSKTIGAVTGAGAGQAYVIVSVTDALGTEKADSVLITIG